MESPKHRIKLTLTEGIALATLFGLCALVFFGAFFALLHKNGQHEGINWTAVLLLLSALSLTERTVGLIRFSVRVRRLILQEHRMQELQKRAGWQ